MLTTAVFTFLQDDGCTCTLGVRSGELGYIASAGLLPGVDPQTFFEIHRMIRTGPTGDIRAVVQIARAVERLAFAVSEGLPLLWVCSKEHARVYSAVFTRHGFAVDVLRGSLRRDNPYPPLVLHDDVTGGSDDEHVVGLSLRV